MKKLHEWWRKKRRARALRKINKLRRRVEPIGKLRQIIYLDAVALRSLYISRYGPEDARITISNSKTRDAELSGSFNLPTSGFGSAQLGGQLGRSSEDAIQVERISSEQSLLKDFLDRESIAGGDGTLWDATPRPDGVNSTGPINLERGTLALVRLRLEADVTFRISSLADSIANLAESSPDIGLTGTSEMLQMAGVLRQLLLEQAPINAELIDWGYCPEQQSLVTSLGAASQVRFAALTELSNYWIDVRRALFDDAVCTALVRVSENFPSTKWSPVKLFDAVRGIPGLEGIEASVADVTDALNVSMAEGPSHVDSFTPALEAYACHRFPSLLPDVVHRQISRISEQYLTEPDTATAFADALDEVDQLADLAEAPVRDPDAIGRLRSEALKRVLKSAQEQPRSDLEEDMLGETPIFLVGEIIALYW